MTETRHATACSPALAVHDAARFPIVVLHTAAIEPGYAARWIADMEALLADGRSFVVILLGGRSAESRDDQKARSLWFKANSERLRATCRGFVAVETDDAARELRRKQAAGLQAALGVRMIMTVSDEEAEAAAGWLLKPDVPPFP